MPTENTVLWCGVLFPSPPLPLYALFRPQYRDNAVLKVVIVPCGTPHSSKRHLVGVLWLVRVLQDKIVYYMTIKRKIR